MEENTTEIKIICYLSEMIKEYNKLQLGFSSLPDFREKFANLINETAEKIDKTYKNEQN